MKKAIDYAEGLPYPYPSHRAFTAALRAKLRRNGVPYGNATYDDAGDCRVCGEAGRCPGVHTLDEIQAHRNLVEKEGTPCPS